MNFIFTIELSKQKKLEFKQQKKYLFICKIYMLQ